MQVSCSSMLALADFRDPLLPLWLMELLADVFFHTWLFAFGATVGSFLNVVIYRLPRGKNLAFPGSFCPRCGIAIRLADNIPIVSWLALGGRCRHCQEPISPRYFVVELLIAGSYLAVLVAEHLLPPLALGAPTRRMLESSDGIPFWVMYAIHVSYLTTLVGAILIAADGFRVPARLYLPVFIAAFAAPLVWPAIRSVAAISQWRGPDWQVGLLDGVAGSVAGCVVGMGFELVARRMNRAGSSLAPVALATTLGAVVGWQRVLWLAPLVLLAAEWLVRGVRALALRRQAAAAVAVAVAEEPPPVEPTSGELLSAALPPPPEIIQEEVHIAPAPTEPTESS